MNKSHTKKAQNSFKINKKEQFSLAESYFREAEMFRSANRYKEAVNKYLHSILIDKNNPDSYMGLAIAYKNLKNYDKAVMTLEKVEKILPFDFNVQKELALCNIIKGDFAKGIKYLISSIKLAPDNIDIQMQLAMVHEMINEEDMALMIYQKIIETNPEYIRAYIQKATLYMHLEDYLSGAKIFREIIKINPNYFRAYLALGICYEKLGNVLSAKRFYKKYLNFENADFNRKGVLKRLSGLKADNINICHLKLLPSD